MSANITSQANQRSTTSPPSSDRNSSQVVAIISATELILLLTKLIRLPLANHNDNPHYPYTYSGCWGELRHRHYTQLPAINYTAQPLCDPLQRNEVRQSENCPVIMINTLKKPNEAGYKIQCEVIEMEMATQEAGYSV